MKAVLDACVLYPTVMREVLLEAAALGGFAPVWSPRILEEWARATRRLEAGEAVARAEIAVLRDRWPAAEVTPSDALIAGLALPDPDDRHVLAAAVAAGAEVLITRNRADFPGRTLARHGVLLREPDGFLAELHRGGLDLGPAAARVRARAERAAGGPLPLRPLLKRAGLPRLGKALDGPRAPA